MACVLYSGMQVVTLGVCPWCRESRVKCGTQVLLTNIICKGRDMASRVVLAPMHSRDMLLIMWPLAMAVMGMATMAKAKEPQHMAPEPAPLIHMPMYTGDMPIAVARPRFGAF